MRSVANLKSLLEVHSRHLTRFILLKRLPSHTVTWRQEFKTFTNVSFRFYEFIMNENKLFALNEQASFAPVRHSLAMFIFIIFFYQCFNLFYQSQFIFFYFFLIWNMMTYFNTNEYNMISNIHLYCFNVNTMYTQGQCI